MITYRNIRLNQMFWSTLSQLKMQLFCMNFIWTHIEKKKERIDYSIT